GGRGGRRRRRGGGRRGLAVAGGLLVGAGVAEDRVEQADHVHRVAAGVDRHVDGQLGVVAGTDAGRALGVPVGGGAAAGAVPLVAARAVPVVAGSAGTVAGVAAGAVAGAAVAGVVVTGVVVAAGGARGAAVRLAVVLVLRHVRALVAERRVEGGDHVDRVAADVDRDVHRGLDVVAGHDARRALRGAFRLRVGEGGAAAQGQNARRGCRRDHSLAQGLSQCL